MANNRFIIINKYEADLICDAINNYVNRGFNDFISIDAMTKKRRITEQDLKQYAMIIENYIEDKYFSNEVVKKTYDLIICTLESSRLKDEELCWLDFKNKRLCNWVWFTFIEGNIFQNLRRNAYGILKFNSFAMNYKEKHTDIIRFFRKANCDKNTKLLILNDLKSLWLDISKDNRVNKILVESNCEQCIWAYNYIVKKFSLQNDVSINDDLISINNNLGFNDKFIINESSDYYFNVIAYYDLIINLHEKSYKIDCLKKAWSQKKLRDSDNGKKSFNFRMDTSISAKLTKMSDSLQINKNKLVEQLIEKRYQEFLNK